MSRLLLGLVAGAGAALLFAPRSGTELREEIVNRGRELKDSLLERGRELIGSVETRTNGSMSHSNVSSM